MRGGESGCWWWCTCVVVDADAWPWWLCCVCVDVSLSGNILGDGGGYAISEALSHLSSLTTLEYVRSEGGVCGVTVMRLVVGGRA